MEAVSVANWYLAPKSASPQYVAAAVARIADVTSSDVLLDVGCGDARTLIAVAKETGCRCVGVEIDEQAYAKAVENITSAGLQARIELLHADALDVDLRSVTVLYLYLLPKGLQKLLKKLEDELAPGCRVLSFMFRIPRWEGRLERVERISSGRSSDSKAAELCRVYVYKKSGVLVQAE